MAGRIKHVNEDWSVFTFTEIDMQMIVSVPQSDLHVRYGVIDCHTRSFIPLPD
jgi:hypothetical protein